MRLTIDWLREHLETTATIEEIIQALENLGLPCEKVWKAHEAWNEVEIVRITNKEAHPNADKLNLYDIELKNGDKKKLVCGDQTLQIGMFVPYARDGVIAPATGCMLKVAKIRGVESPGMLCSANDLCLPIESNAVLRCSQDMFGGTISQIFESTGIIEIEVTPNRGDVLSIRGIARALAGHNIGTLKPLIATEQNYQDTNELAKIESTNCTALAVAEIAYQASQTKGMIAARLLLTSHGVTGIDIVDLTNYVAHELGQPMHAFDATKLNGAIMITNLKQEEEYEALNEQKILLEKNTLVIKDNSKIVSWPGVIGGKNSKTEPTTSKILLETGVFKIDSMQRRKNKIYTSSAKKFECGIDPMNLENAINRYCYLLGNIRTTKAESHKFKQEKTIEFNLSYIKKILGIDITLEQLKSRLEPKGFCIAKTEIKEHDIIIQVPSYKFFDIHSPNCIVEEYATGYYDNIESINLPPRLPKTTKNEKSWEDKLTESAIACGFFQTYHFTLTNENDLEYSNNVIDEIKIKNSTNNNYATLRASMIPQLLRTCSWHENNSHHHRRFFEIGTIYGNDIDSNDKNAIYTHNQTNVFTAIAQNPIELLRILYHFTQHNLLIAPKATQQLTQKWQDSGDAFFEQDSIIAACGRIKQNLIRATIDSKDDYYAIEIYLNNLAKLQKKQYNKPSAQTPVYKDISFNLPPETPINHVTSLLDEHKYNYEIFDIYPSTDKSSQRNLGLRLQFDLDETVTKNDLNQLVETVKALVLKKLNITSNQ